MPLGALCGLSVWCTQHSAWHVRAARSNFNSHNTRKCVLGRSRPWEEDLHERDLLDVPWKAAQWNRDSERPGGGGYAGEDQEKHRQILEMMMTTPNRCPNQGPRSQECRTQPVSHGQGRHKFLCISSPPATWLLAFWEQCSQQETQALSME